MSVAGLLIITVQSLTDLPADIHNAVVMVRVLSRKERKVPRLPETVTAVASVSDKGVANFEVDDPHIEVYAPFPREDVIRINVSTAPKEDPFAVAALIRVSSLEKARHIERTFQLTHPKTKEACGTLKLSINYVSPTVEVPENVIADKLRSTAAPGKTLTFKQALAVLQDVDNMAEIAKSQGKTSASSDAKDKPEKTEKTEKTEKSEKPEKSEKIERSKKGEKAEKTEKSDKQEEPEKKDKSESSEKSEDYPKDEEKRDDSKGRLTKSKKRSHRSSHKEKSTEETIGTSSKSNGSSGSGSSGNGSKHDRLPSPSSDDLSAAMNGEPDSPQKPVSVPQLKVIAHAAGDTRDLMLGPTPRNKKESLRNVVEARPRAPSGGSRSDKAIRPVPKGNAVARETPIVASPCENLTFGLHSHQASLETDLLETITLENKSAKVACFRFLLKNNDHPKYSIYAEPDVGKLKPGQKMDVTLKLIIHCTTHLRLSVPVAVWKGHMKDYDSVPTETITLTAGIQSKLSTKLDSEEVEIFRPPIGSGAFGTVYRGKYRGFEVAVKVLKDQANPSPELMEAFETEVEMAEALRHTSIVNFVGAVHFKNQLAIVTEFCPFGDLSYALKKYPFPYPLKLKALLDASRAMDYLHQSGMIHRDLKTENLLVVSLEAMSQTVCKLSDFGTARGLNSFAQAKTMMLTKGVGTPIFMAPEMLQGSQSYTEGADVYSFGVMMCHVANNELPYTHDHRFDSSYQFVQKVIAGMRPELKSDIPADYKKLMTECWDKDPLVRPPFSEISDALEDMFFAARSSLPSASILQN